MRLPEFWSQCLALLQSELSEQQFSRDIAPITVGERHGAWVLFAKTQFAANLLRTQYAQKIREAAAALRPAAAANPQNADAMNALGLALLRGKDYRGAWHAWTEAARLAPDSGDILINQILLAASCKDAAEKKEKKKRK